MIHFYGGLKDGVMDFYTDEIPQPDGTKLKRHLQFFNLSPDKVRQFSPGVHRRGQNLGRRIRLYLQPQEINNIDLGRPTYTRVED